MVGMNSVKMRKEAVKRMYRLGLNFSVIDDFEYGRLRCSDHDKMTDVPEEILKEIAEWERKFHNIVYHVVHGDFGYETYECLSVSNYKEDWDYENSIMDDNWVMSHSINIDIPSYTESGSIKVINNNGILKRIN